MIHRFSTFEDAILFALAKQQDGYFAEMLHLNSGFIYGSIASNGFPVLVSEYAAQGNEEAPETKISHSALLHLIAKILFGASMVILTIPLMFLGYSLIMTAIIFPIGTAIVVFDLLWKAGVFLILFSIYMQAIIFTYNAFRDSSSVWNRRAVTIFKIVLYVVLPAILLTVF